MRAPFLAYFVSQAVQVGGNLAMEETKRAKISHCYIFYRIPIVITYSSTLGFRLPF